jgi:hypothetical protein
MISMVYLNGNHEVEVFGHWIRSSPMHSYRYRQIRLEICSPYDRATEASTFKMEAKWKHHLLCHNILG